MASPNRKAPPTKLRESSPVIPQVRTCPKSSSMPRPLQRTAVGRSKTRRTPPWMRNLENSSLEVVSSEGEDLAALVAGEHACPAPIGPWRTPRPKGGLAPTGALKGKHLGTLWIPASAGMTDKKPPVAAPLTRFSTLQRVPSTCPRAARGGPEPRRHIVKSRAEAGSRKPEAGSRKPEAGSRKPEAGSRKPEAGSRLRRQ
jgi:hypothetical protein